MTATPRFKRDQIVKESGSLGIILSSGEVSYDIVWIDGSTSRYRYSTGRHVVLADESDLRSTYEIERLLSDLELVRGIGIAELRGFASYRVVAYSTVRFNITANMVLQYVRIIADDANGWTACGLRATGNTVLELLSSADFIAEGDGWSIRGGGIPLRPGMHELLVSNTAWRLNRQQEPRARFFRASIRGLGHAGEIITEIGSGGPVQSSSQIVFGERWLLDLDGTVWRFSAGTYGRFYECLNTTMPDVSAQHLTHPEHVDRFETHYEHHPGAPIRFVSLHVWAGSIWRHGDDRPKSVAGMATQCPVLYGIDEQSDRLVLEVGRTNLIARRSGLPQEPPFFHGRVDLNGLEKPWWWEAACRAREKSFALAQRIDDGP